jgi:hypothetical protein
MNRYKINSNGRIYTDDECHASWIIADLIRLDKIDLETAVDMYRELMEGGSTSIDDIDTLDDGHGTLTITRI